MELNQLFLTDSYKTTQWPQYPPDTEKIYSYFESRGGEFPTTVFFGLQYVLDRFKGQVVTGPRIDEAAKFWKAHVGHFNRAGWEHILDRHDGYLPVEIKAVPEGTEVPTGNILMSIENTDPACYWLTNWLETVLVQTWYPATICTQSLYMKRNLLEALKRSGDPSLIDFKLHDFGFRGVSCCEQAGIGGMAHLVNFKGTDTTPGILFAQQYYNADMCGFSIPASEHSTMCSWGRDKENEAMANMLAQFPTGLVACVSDSYDIFNACEKIWGTELKDKILARDGCLVIRPDSGDPCEVLPRVLQILARAFGGEMNGKGFYVLNPKVRVIQGDGIDRKSMGKILTHLLSLGWSADNIAFGSGGGLLQAVNRDTCKFAFKCSAKQTSGEWIDVYKDPVTDEGKKSKRGKLHLFKHEGRYVTWGGLSNKRHWADQLQTVFKNGQFVRRYTFDEVKKNASTL